MTKTSERAKPGGEPPRVDPIYKRLPHGPHRLARNEVIRHQRARIHGAMVEAVARSGYERTSVKQVIGLAGVSRRSFYEQFANKEECFLATFDLLAHRDIQRMAKAYASTGGDLDARLLAAYSGFTEEARRSPNAAMLVLVEAQTAGVGGTVRLRRALASCEQMLGRSLADSPEGGKLPRPILRGITGGLHGAVARVLRDPQARRHAALPQEMVRWTLLFPAPGAERMEERLAARLSRRMREISLASAHPSPEPLELDADEPQRLMHNVLRLAVLHDYRDLTAPQIADEASVPIDSFLELFANRDECFLAALEMVGDELLGIVADPDLISSDWPQAVRRVLGELLSYLGDRPLYSRTIAQQAFFAGPDAVARNLELAQSIATLLTEGAPGPAGSALAVDAIAGALLHTVRCQVAGGRIQLLAALSDYLAYVVLAPFIGAEAAIELLSEDPPD